MTQDIYHERAKQFDQDAQQLQQKHTSISVLRLIIALAFLYVGYTFFQDFNQVYGIVCLALLGSFIALMKWHNRISTRKKFVQYLAQVNKNELDFLKGTSIPFENGNEFSETNHPFAFDLDIFGEKSLYQYLNRTVTYKGKEQLSNLLKEVLPFDAIVQNQKSVAELSDKLDWRQRLMARAKVNQDDKTTYQYLIAWANQPATKLSVIIRILSFLLPVLFTSLCVYLYVTKDSEYVSLATTLFILNLGILGSQIKLIKSSLLGADKIGETIFQYAEILKQIEQEKFESERLKSLQHDLHNAQTNASKELATLSSLFDKLDSISNGVGLILFNGTILYHLHVLNSLLKWKAKNASHIQTWLNVIAEFESLNSLGNFKYNNKNYCFPELNKSKEITFSNLSHPLLSPETRVSNDVDFSQHHFVILTGSNMSGKSTFLRSLGINMLLSGIGSCVCATQATVHPLNIYVSMRLSDSLSDSESYFFAEVKRLKEIMTHLERGEAFILLDEILRGTNSDDKRNGTIQVIEKLMEKHAVGAIATHDLEVCNTQLKYPNEISNKCFEVEIIKDDLHFDYKLRPGVCQNKSASFLMKKMEII